MRVQSGKLLPVHFEKAQAPIKKAKIPSKDQQNDREYKKNLEAPNQDIIRSQREHLLFTIKTQKLGRHTADDTQLLKQWGASKSDFDSLKKRIERHRLEGGMDGVKKKFDQLIWGAEDTTPNPMTNQVTLFNDSHYRSLYLAEGFMNETTILTNTSYAMSEHLKADFSMHLQYATHAVTEKMKSPTSKDNDILQYTVILRALMNALLNCKDLPVFDEKMATFFYSLEKISSGLREQIVVHNKFPGIIDYSTLNLMHTVKTQYKKHTHVSIVSALTALSSLYDSCEYKEGRVQHLVKNFYWTSYERDIEMFYKMHVPFFHQYSPGMAIFSSPRPYKGLTEQATDTAAGAGRTGITLGAFSASSSCSIQ